MRITIIILFTVVSNWCFSQSGYTIPDTSITFTKDITFGTVHGYLEIKSDTADTLPMAWVARKEIGMPTAWVVNFDDQSNYHPVVETNDRDTFNLAPNNTSNRKLIIGLAHNSTGDTSSIFFTIYPISSPEDSAVIEYKFEISKEPINPIDTSDTSTAVVKINSQKPTLKWISEDKIIFDQRVDKISVYDLSGRIVSERMNSDQCTIPNHALGVHVVRFEQDGDVFTRKVVL